MPAIIGSGILVVKRWSKIDRDLKFASLFPKKSDTLVSLVLLRLL